jgi:hypothetical protein
MKLKFLSNAASRGRRGLLKAALDVPIGRIREEPLRPIGHS